MITDPRLKYLSPKQRMLVNIARTEGFVTTSVALKIYDKKENAINALKKLVSLGFLKIDNEIPNKFDYVYENEKKATRRLLDYV